MLGFVKQVRKSATLVNGLVKIQMVKVLQTFAEERCYRVMRSVTAQIMTVTE